MLKSLCQAGIEPGSGMLWDAVQKLLTQALWQAEWHAEWQSQAE